jgi:hypothetical protein
MVQRTSDSQMAELIIMNIEKIDFDTAARNHASLG